MESGGGWRGEERKTFLTYKKITVNLEIHTQQKISFRSKGKILIQTYKAQRIHHQLKSAGRKIKRSHLHRENYTR